MFAVVVACVLLLVTTCVLHYEVLRALSAGLPKLTIPNRTKLLVVLLAAFLAHAAQMLMYGFALYILIAWFGAGTLEGKAGFSLETCLYFSAETYTSLGFGEVTPGGAVRLLAGVEALNGLLMIGWTASFTYLAMERFWTDRSGGL